MQGTTTPKKVDSFFFCAAASKFIDMPWIITLQHKSEVRNTNLLTSIANSHRCAWTQQPSAFISRHDVHWTYALKEWPVPRTKLLLARALAVARKLGNAAQMDDHTNVSGENTLGQPITGLIRAWLHCAALAAPHAPGFVRCAVQIAISCSATYVRRDSTIVRSRDRSRATARRTETSLPHSTAQTMRSRER